MNTSSTTMKTAKHQQPNGSIDHAFGLTASASRSSSQQQFNTGQNSHVNSFNFDDNFTEFNTSNINNSSQLISSSSSSSSSKNTTTLNGFNELASVDTTKYETVSVVGQSKVTKSSMSSLSSNNTTNSFILKKHQQNTEQTNSEDRKYIMNNYDSISYNKTTNMLYPNNNNGSTSTAISASSELRSLLRDEFKQSDTNNTNLITNNYNENSNYYDNGYDEDEYTDDVHLHTQSKSLKYEYVI